MCNKPAEYSVYIPRHGRPKLCREHLANAMRTRKGAREVLSLPKTDKPIRCEDPEEI